jgi:hypothetical protein
VSKIEWVCREARQLGVRPGNPAYLRVKVPRLEEICEATTICKLGDDVQNVVCDPVVVVPVVRARWKGSSGLSPPRLTSKMAWLHHRALKHPVQTVTAKLNTCSLSPNDVRVVQFGE